MHFCPVATMSYYPIITALCRNLPLFSRTLPLLGTCGLDRKWQMMDWFFGTVSPPSLQLSVRRGWQNLVVHNHIWFPVQEMAPKCKTLHLTMKSQPLHWTRWDFGAAVHKWPGLAHRRDISRKSMWAHSFKWARPAPQTAAAADTIFLPTPPHTPSDSDKSVPLPITLQQRFWRKHSHWFARDVSAVGDARSLMNGCTKTHMVRWLGFSD